MIDNPIFKNYLNLLNLSQLLMGDESPTSRIRRVRVSSNLDCENIWQFELPQNLYGSAKGRPKKKTKKKGK